MLLYSWLMPNGGYVSCNACELSQRQIETVGTMVCNMNSRALWPFGKKRGSRLHGDVVV